MYISKEPYGPANLVYSSASLLGTSFTIPAGYLVSDTKYRWQMTSIANGVESPSASSLLYFQAPTPVGYALNLSSSPSAGGVTSGGGSITSGSSVTVLATANPGYSFVNWTESGVAVSNTADYTLRVNTNRNLVANFAAAQAHSINIVNAASGKPNPVAPGQRAPIRAFAKSFLSR